MVVFLVSQLLQFSPWVSPQETIAKVEAGDGQEEQHTNIAVAQIVY